MLNAKHYHVYEQLNNGRTVLIRAIRKTDKRYLIEGLHHLSKKSIYLRFHGPKKELSEQELVYFTELDFHCHVGLVVLFEQNDDPEAVAVGRYICGNEEPPFYADLALTVKDQYQGIGIGSLLLKHLILIAQENRVITFEADVLVPNQRMINILRHSGLPYRRSTSAGETHFSISLKHPV